MVDTKKLEGLLRDLLPWKRQITDIPGIFIVKAPESTNSPARLLVEINPVDHSTGKTLKRKGLFVTTYEQFVGYTEAFEDERVSDLVKQIEAFTDKTSPKSIDNSDVVHV
jgi:hypothetical protein